MSTVPSPDPATVRLTPSDQTQTLEAALDAPVARPGTSGTRSGMLLGAASAVSIVVNYAFLLAAGRILGSEDYGSLAALLGLLAIVLIPASAIQLAASREVSRRLAGGDVAGANAFARAALRLALRATVPLVTVALALAVPLGHLLNIKSVGVVILAELTLVTALAAPVAMGVLQGTQRFHALAAIYVVPLLMRLGVLAVAAAAGYRLGAAVFATVVAAFVGILLAIALIREPLQASASAPRPNLRPFLRYLGPVLVGLIGIALLTHVDILVVKARFSADDAGAYAAASAFARVGFFLPATILAVLFPLTAARQARGEETEDILGRSLLATAVFCAALALFYAAAGVGLVSTTFGPGFAEGGRVLAPYALAIGLFSLANILVGYHLSRGETRYAWIVAVGVLVQVALLAVWPTSLHQVVWANVLVGLALLAVHELVVGSSAAAVRAGFRHFARSITLQVRRVAIEAGIVLLAMTVFVCVLFWPMVRAINTTVIGRGSDATGTIWWLWSLQHEGGYHLFGTTHHTLTAAPFGWDGANGLNIQWLIPYYPAYLATKIVGPVAAHNLVLLSGYVLSGASMYLLVRYLGCTRLVAAWAGLVYIVFPWHLERTPHASLVHLEFLPLLLLAMVAATRKPSWSRFLAVGVVAVACWLTSGYFGTMAVVGAVAFALGTVISKARRRPRFVLALAAASTLGASLLVGLLSVVSGVGRGSGLHRVASDLSVYGVRLLELVVPAGKSIVFGHWTGPFWETRQHRSNETETTNYLGLLTIGLALWWLVFARWRRTILPDRLRLATMGLLAVTVVSILLALPSPLSVSGHEIWMPSRVLWTAVPPFRVPSRWVVLAMAGLVPLAALALQQLATRLSATRVRWRGITAAPIVLVGAALVVSFLELSTNPTASRFRTTNLPPVYSALSRTPRGIVAEYPLMQNIDHLFWQQFYDRPVLNNEAFGTPADDARRVLVDPSTPGAAPQLALLGVTAIVTHPDALAYAEGIPKVPNASWGPGYSLVARTPDGSSVWDVVARPAPALVTMASGLGGPQPLAGGVVGYPLTSSSGVGYFGLRAQQPGIIRLSFDAAPPTNGPRVLRVADATHELPFTLGRHRRISVLVQIPRGFSLVLLKTDPAPQSAADAIMLSVAYATRATGSPDLHALPEAADPGF